MKLAALGLLLATAAHAALPRFPNEHAGQIVFVADGNLWEVPAAGGTARRLTSDPGQDMFPRFSPDGKWIAFTASYQGNEDVYVIPAEGGPARRLTYQSDLYPGTGGRHGPNNMVVTWTPDSQSIVFLSRRQAWNGWIAKLFTVPLAGGLPQNLPLDSGGLLTYAPDGKSIAYNRIFRNFRTWKRYTGGLAQQVFTYDFATRQLTQITDWKGTNTAPMWAGRKIYYLSDQGPAFRANIWVYDLDTKQTRQVTHFTDSDIDFPSLGDTAITFQQGGALWRLDLADQSLHNLPLTVPDDATRTAPRMVNAADHLRDTDIAQQVDYALSPNGKRALFSARGDIFSVPAEHGATRDLTNSETADEDHPAWSPDGTQIAYTTDVSGEQQIAIRPALGGAERIITHFPTGYLYTPVFSPDGKQLAFSDSAHRLWLASTDGTAPRQVAQNGINEIHDQSFSPDGRYLVWSMNRDAQMHAIYLHDIAANRTVQLSQAPNDDQYPRFSPDGKYLYFVSIRHENPVPSDIEFDFADLRSQGIYVATLARDAPSPFAPRSDEGAFTESKPDNKPWKPGPIKPIRIDIGGLMDRAVAVPLPANEIGALDVRDGKIFYLSQALQMLEGELPGETNALHVFDIDKRHDGVVASNIDNYSLSADGARVLVKQKKSFTVLDAKDGTEKDGGDSKKTLDTDSMRLRADPPAEWAEMFDNAWRLERDFFFSTAMNGANWQAMHDAYKKLLKRAGSREDVTYLIGQLLGEIGNSHTYVGGGDDGDQTKPAPTPELGADYVLDAASGLTRFATIYQGDNTRPEYRAPLTEPGLDIHAGDYLLAINGHALRAPDTPYSLMAGLDPGQPVTLTIAASPDAKPRDVTVLPVAHDIHLREKAWIDHNRETVDRLSGGRVGYIYLSDMEMLGMQQFIRQFYADLGKQALIIDDRWNNGGFIDQMALERLRRILIGLDVNRERTPIAIPNQVVPGPKICLINHYSASDGDIFPYFFRAYHLGKLLGTRSWGGVRGIRGELGMMDGGYVTVPEEAMYNLESQWIIENHGVDPDIEIENQPADLQDGQDKQLETAVQLLVQQLTGLPAGLPAPPPLLPAYPPAGQVPPPSH
jgi:tricorn protease